MSTYPVNHQEKSLVCNFTCWNKRCYQQRLKANCRLNSSIKISNILKSLPDCRVIVSKPQFRSDNSKAAPTIQNLDKDLSNLNIECTKNDNINDRHLGKKGLHLNTKGKGRLTLKFLKRFGNSDSPAFRINTLYNFRNPTIRYSYLQSSF